MTGPILRSGPAVPTIPLVLDSPHSGRTYPADFDHACLRAALQSMEDPFMDELAAPATALGAVMIATTVPRTYVDPNRDDTAIDLELMDGAWDGPIEPSNQARIGRGVVFRRLPRIIGRIPVETDIYAHRLTPAEVAGRLDRCWRPYHRALLKELDAAHGAFGTVIHLDMHSCYPAGLAELNGEGGDNPDITLTDNGGSSADPKITERLAEHLRTQGWWVGINDPFPSSSIARRYGDPARNRHSIMIEVNRRRYLDITTFERSPGFADCQATLHSLYIVIAAEWRSLTGG
jgi:N-formylglutamate deformylase